MDSTEIPVYGEQEQSAYNGHFESTCYHPLLLFNRDGDCLAAKLRPGNVHSAESWEELLLPEIEWQQKLGKEVAFRADAAFAQPEIYEALESRGVKYAIRIPANENLERDIVELLTRPVGRPSHKPVVWYKGFLVSSHELEYGAAGGSEGRTSCRGVVPAHWIHRDQSDTAEPRGGAVLQQARDGRAVDQGRQAGSKDDTVELPPVSVERGAAVAERDCLQPGQSVAAAGAPKGNRNVVIDQPAAAVGENRRTVGKACSLLLAAPGGESSDAAPVRKHAAADGGFAAASWIDLAGRRKQSGRWGLTKKCPSNCFEMGKIWVFGSRKRPSRARPGFWDGNGCKKDGERRQMGVNSAQPRGKMEIPGLRRVRASIDRRAKRRYYLNPCIADWCELSEPAPSRAPSRMGRSFSIGGGCDATDGFFAA